MAEVESRSRVSTDNLARDHLYDKRLETQSSLVDLCQYPVCPVCGAPACLCWPCYSLSAGCHHPGVSWSRPGLALPRGHQRHRGLVQASRAGGASAGAASVMGVVLDLRQGYQIRSGSFRLKPNLKWQHVIFCLHHTECSGLTWLCLWKDIGS